MNDNNEKKVRRGDRLQIPAATWNNIVDGMKNFKRTKFNKPNSVNNEILTDLISSNVTILTYNASDYDQSTSFRIMRLNGTVIDVSSDILEANRRIAFNAYVPTDSTNPIAILQSPLEMGEIGKAVTSGMTVTRVKMVDFSHEWANPVADSTDYLLSASDGQARIVWFGLSDDVEEQEAGIYLAIVHLIGVIPGVGTETSQDLVTNVCPIFEDITYTQAIDEYNDMLSRVEDSTPLVAVSDGSENDVYQRRLIGFTIESRNFIFKAIKGSKECRIATENECCVEESGESGESGNGSNSGISSGGSSPIPGTTCEEAGILSVPDTYTGDIEAFGEEWFTFNVVNGVNYNLDFSAIILTDVRCTIYGGSCEALDPLESSFNDHTFNWTSSYTGSVWLKITKGAGLTNTYTLDLS